MTGPDESSPAEGVSPKPDIRPVRAEDVTPLAEVLAKAFHDDPLWTWLLPDPARRPRTLRRFFARFTKSCLVRGDTVLTTRDLRGVAVWRRPGTWRDQGGDVLRLAPATLRFGMTGLRRGFAIGRQIEPRHPREHHWYLSVLGTDPAAQGQGVGTALVRAGTDLADDEGLPAYLETETLSNVAFYTRHGFTTRDELDIGADGPHLWLLWRDPPG